MCFCVADCGVGVLSTADVFCVGVGVVFGCVVFWGVVVVYVVSVCVWLLLVVCRFMGVVVVFVSGVYVFFAGANGVVSSAYCGFGTMFWMVTVRGNSLIWPMDAVVLSFVVSVIWVLARNVSEYMSFA